MREFAIVKEIKNDGIFVIPMLTMACLKCKTGCLRQGKPFRVKNSAQFSIKSGTAVRIGLPRFARAFHGLLSLFVPISFAVFGFFIAPAAVEILPLSILKSLSEESARAVFVLGFLAFSTLVTFIVSRSSIHFSTPEIISIM